MYGWLHDLEHAQLVSYAKVSRQTATDYMQHFRQLAAMMIEEDRLVIGGQGIEVEIDESKFAKRKYHRGHSVGTKDWVVGAIEKHLRTGELKKRFWAVIVKDRSRATLEPIIREFIRPGSIVHSDFWKGYDFMSLPNSGYTHMKVNHSVEYKNKTTGACTNTIEAKWGATKRQIPTKARSHNLDGYLDQKIWKDQNHHDLEQDLINALKDIK